LEDGFEVVVGFVEEDLGALEDELFSEALVSLLLFCLESELLELSLESVDAPSEPLPAELLFLP